MGISLQLSSFILFQVPEWCITVICNWYGGQYITEIVGIYKDDYESCIFIQASGQPILLHFLPFSIYSFVSTLSQYIQYMCTCTLYLSLTALVESLSFCSSTCGLVPLYYGLLYLLVLYSSLSHFTTRNTEVRTYICTNSYNTNSVL